MSTVIRCLAVIDALFLFIMSISLDDAEIGISLFALSITSAIFLFAFAKIVEAAEVYIKINRPILESEKANKKRLSEIEKEIAAIKGAQKILDAENE